MNSSYEKDGLYVFFEKSTEQSSTENFHLHYHNEYEIFLFQEGDSKYIVEENAYDLEPNDIIVIKKHQLHRIYHNSNSRYRRLVLSVSPQFFQVNDCPEYENAFINLFENNGNKINADVVKSSGLYDAIMRAKKYSRNFSEPYSPAVMSCVTEILYLINNIKFFSSPNNVVPHLKDIISYINNNITKNITLSDLEDRFFISKYHLCHIFPQATGLTVHQYITKKRLSLARELIDSGKTINEASQRSGFNTYSSFYRAYLNEYGISPKNASIT